MKSKSSEIRCLYASSEQSADVLYLAGVFVPDAFLSFQYKGKSLAVVSQLEYGRVRSSSNFDQVWELGATRNEAAECLKLTADKIGPCELIRFVAEAEGAAILVVPEDFPAGLFSRLQQSGQAVRVAEGDFFPDRAIKSDEEAKAIRQGNAASAAGIRAAEAVLRCATIKGKRLVYEGATLTSERLRAIIDQTCLGKGAVARNTIVAGGAQAADPHEGGQGPLRPNELIIIDVFPRLQSSGYHGDMTRTFLKGKANDSQRKLVGAVREAQRAAFGKVKSGVSGAMVHKAAVQVFEAQKFVTERRGDHFVGFIHSTGHGLGLEVHESPRVSPTAGRLRKGNVITIEPGLYYPDLGGCRIEDVLRVTTSGYEQLSSFHYRWELP